MFFVEPMTLEDAKTICTWRYEAPADIYNTENSEEAWDSFMDELHFSVRDRENGPLLGYIAFGPAATLAHPELMHIYENEAYTDIALGLDPARRGKGLGTEIFTLAMEMAGESFPEDGFRVTVAADNEPALRIYRKMGFEVICDLQAEIIYPDFDEVERTCRKNIYVMVKG
ncbi:MAG: GNAT family N-acetyltransferase [Clostridia bacterium]|nr:GNAT family N-acetyltransferase [Clostridia bacterium]